MENNSDQNPDTERPLKGYRYFVTDEQIREHQQRSVLEILEWIESTNEFLYRFQTPEARAYWMKIRKGEM